LDELIPSAGPVTIEKKVMVLGVGNILLRDEGVGVRVIERLRPLMNSSEVELMTAPPPASTSCLSWKASSTS
jgi:hypothetical protein